jgi:hypothetical protein
MHLMKRDFECAQSSRNPKQTGKNQMQMKDNLSASRARQGAGLIRGETL